MLIRGGHDIYKQILDVAADAIVTVDEGQEIVDFNRGAEQIFGYERNEVIGTSLDRLLPSRFRAAHPGYVAAFGRSTETARLMGHRREVFGLRKDGTEFPAEASIIKLEALNGRNLYTAVVRDVTDRKRLDQQQRFLAEVSAVLGESLDHATTLESVVRLPVPALADACLLEFINESGKSVRLSHSVDGSALLQSVAAVGAPRPSRGELVSELSESWLRAHGESADTIAALRAADVRSLMIVPLVVLGEIAGVLIMTRTGATRRYDAGDLVIAENFAARAALALDHARLYQNARSATRARDEVLGVVSHDLRNPLSAIAMCSRVLVDSPPPSDDARRELAKTIYDATTWMSRMIKDLLDVSAIDAGVLSVTCSEQPVEPMLARATELFRGAALERHIDLRFEAEASLPTVNADAERFVQALANLVANAVKFTSSGGTVIVAASARESAVEIAISDSGRGIAEADLPHIFDRYWHARGNAAGAGLGLAIAKGIIEAHGGHIQVTSQLELGSRFTITIPMKRHVS